MPALFQRKDENFIIMSFMELWHPCRYEHNRIMVWNKQAFQHLNQIITT